MSIEAIYTETVPPPGDFEVGTVTDRIPVDPNNFDLHGELTPGEIVRAEIYDPNVAYLNEIHPGRIAELQRQETFMNAFSKFRFGKWRRQENTIAYLQGAPVLSSEESVAHGDALAKKGFFNDPSLLGDPALRAWQTTIPTAAALVPLANPFNMKEVSDRHGESFEMTDKTREWMTACTDGREIRNRTAVMVEEMGSYLANYAAAKPDEQMTVISVAGGTALPTMQAIMHSGVAPERIRLLLLESDTKSADMALELAERIGFKSDISRKDIDVFDPKQMKELADELEQTDAKAVALDAVGIAEYSSVQQRTDARAKRWGEDYMLYNPDQFIAACNSLVRENGMALIGQMRIDRPNPYFTRGVISWPTICMRTVKCFSEILHKGGADLGLTKLTLTPLNTYTMATMYKSTESARIADFQPTSFEATSQRGLRSVSRRVRVARSFTALRMQPQAE